MTELNINPIEISKMPVFALKRAVKPKIDLYDSTDVITETGDKSEITQKERIVFGAIKLLNQQQTQ